MSNSNADKPLTPLENYEAAALKLAIYNQLMRERDEALKPSDAETEARVKEITARAMPKHMALIKRVLRKQAILKRLRGGMPRALKLAACVVLILNLGLTITLAASSAARAYMAEFLLKPNEKYTEIGFYETDANAVVPDGWTGACFPTYIPEGFEVAQVVSGDGGDVVTYINNNNRMFMFEMFSMNTRMNLDTEQAKTSFINIRGSEIIVFDKEGIVSMIWQFGDKFIVMHLSGTVDEATAIAESVRVIKY